MRRVLARIALVLGVLAVLLPGLFAFLFTDPGEALLARLAVSELERRTSMDVEIAKLEFHGDRVVIRGLRAPAFGADELELDFAMSTLVGRVHLNRLGLTGYRLNLDRLPAAKEKGGELPSFVIDTIAVSGGVLKARRVRLEDLAVSGSIAHRSRGWTGEVSVTGTVLRPARLKLAISAGARTEAGMQTARLDLIAGRSRIVANVQLPRGERPDLAQLDGELSVGIPAFESAGFEYGPVRVIAWMDDGRVRVDQLHVALPGLLIQRDPNGHRAFTGHAQIDDLAAATRAVEALIGQPLPELAGRGRLHLKVENPLSSAALAVEGTMHALQLPGVQASELKIDGHVANLSRAGEGRLAVDAAWIEAGSQRLRTVRVKAQRAGERAVLDASIAQPAAASLHLELNGEKLEAVTLKLPDATWAGAGALRFSDDGVELESLQLASNAQRITLGGAWNEDRKFLNVSLTRVRLESFPGSMAGLVDGQVKLSEPESTASLSVSEGRFEGLTGVSAQLKARFAAGRLNGTVIGRALDGTLHGQFSGAPGGAVKANVTLEGASVASAWALVEDQLAGRLSDPAGRLSGTFDVDGSWAAPRVKTRLTVADAAITFEGAERYTGLRVEAQAEATRRKISLSQLVVHAGQGRLEASGTASRSDPARPFSYQLTVNANRFPVPLEDPVLATLKATVEGTAGAERITSKVVFSNVKLERMSGSAT